jgi:hypothetical protein
LLRLAPASESPSDWKRSHCGLFVCNNFLVHANLGPTWGASRSFWAVTSGASAHLGVKDKILVIDLPHELRTKFNSLFELLLRVALWDRSGVPQASDVRNAAINFREQSVKLCALYHERIRAQLVGGFVSLWAALVMLTPISARVSKWWVRHDYVTWVTDGGTN